MQSGLKKRNRPLRVGITGGIGSGKTVVTKIFALLNIPIYNADIRAKWILANNPLVKEGVLTLFGPESFTRGELNKKYIASLVFNNQEKLGKLNALVHPEVGKDFERWAEEQSESDYVLKEAALMFESGSYKLLDKVITVFCPEDLRIQRLLQRDDRRTEKEIRQIMEKQLSDEEKVRRSDYVIFNDETKLLITQVLELDKSIRELS